MAQADRGTTLRQISKVSGVSYKTVKAAFGVPGAPSRTRPIEELVDWLRTASPGAVEIPADLADRMILIRYRTAEEREKRERETAEKIRLHNLERKGRLMEREEVKAQGAAVGMMLSSTLSAWAKDLPSELVGRSELEITRALRSRVDRLISQLRDKLSAL
jgi:hypothetical protein